MGRARFSAKLSGSRPNALQLAAIAVPATHEPTLGNVPVDNGLPGGALCLAVSGRSRWGIGRGSPD
jgi:hypothetical protein